MSITPTKLSNPCAVCDDTSGKCRQGKEDATYFQCMTFADTAKGEIENGFKCIGHAGQWAQFKPDNSGEWNAEKAAEWKARNEQRRKDAAKLDEEKRKRALPVEVRDKAIRALHSHFGLSDIHRADLRGRGLSDEAINRNLYFSIKPDSALPKGIPSNMPGTANGRILAGGEGVACVVFDATGKAVGWQIRIDKAIENKYRWAKNCHLQNGELPVSSFYPVEVRQSDIWITEGILKPAIASHRLGVVAIGSAGGNFAASLLSVADALKVASEKLGTKEIVFAADAGSVSNPHVLATYKRSWELFEGLGYQVKVAWWGQDDKGHPDIDELNDLSKVGFISTAEFLALAEVKKEPEADAAPTTQPTPSVILPSKDGKPRLGFKCYKNDERPEFEETIRQAQRKLRQLSFNADIEINERYLPDELISRLPKSGLIGIKAPKGCGKSVTLNKIIALAKEQGIPVLSITPRISLGREQAVKWEITWIDEYGRTQNSGRNTATQIEKISEKIEKLETKLEVLNRPQQRNLFTDSVAEIELIKAEALAEIEGHKREIDNINISAFNTLALCWDSIWKVKDRNYNNGLVIIDEAELGLKHLITGSTCKRSRLKLIKTFTEIINDCLMMGGRVILSDADLSDLSINYIRESLPIPINPFIVKNEYIGEENTFFVDYRIGNRNCTIQEVIARLKDGQYIFTTADNKKEARALEKLIIKECEGFQRLFDDDNDVIKDAEKSTALIIRLDSGTAESDTGKNIIRKPNEAILKWQPRIVIATPTLGVGVSIDESTQRIVNSVGVPYFDVVVGLFFGVIEPSECRQQLVRVRANVPRIVCCVEGNHRIGGNASFFPEEINRHSMTYSHEALSALDIAKAIAGDDANDEQTMTAMMKLYEDCWDKEGKVWNNPSIKLYSALKARENYGLWNLANLLREEIEDEGHRIVVINGKSGDLIEVMAEIKEADRFAEAEAIKLAPVIEPERARELMKKPSRTSEENRSVVKALLQEELPELELDANFIDKAVLKDNRRWLNSQKLFWMCMNQEATADEDTGSWLRGFRGGVEGGGLFAPDIKSHSPKVKALRESGLFEWIDLENPKKIYEGASPEAKRFLSQALRSRDLIKVALGISVNTNSSPMKIAKLMMQKVGLSLRKVTKSKKDGRHIIDLELASDPDRIRVLTSLDLKWANRSNPVISGAEVGGLRQFVYNKNADVPPIISEKSQCVCDVAIGGESVQNDVLTPAEELTEYLTQFGDSFEMFYSLTEFSPANVVEAAIVAAPTQELRLRWTNFYEAIAAPRREAELAALADF